MQTYMRVCVILFFAVVSAVSFANAQTAQPKQTAAGETPLRSPEVTHTEKGPTGYAVTFRYANPTAKKVQIKGEWYFARPSGLSQIAATPDHPVVEGQGLLPKDWQPGDFPLIKFDPKHPDSLGGNWPIADMTKGSDGVWSYTTPLPSGVFDYSFSVDCTDPDASKCKAISDPNNRPWNVSKDGVADGSVERSSQVYVPSDPNFGTVDYSWQGPARQKGKLTHVTYPSPGHVAPKNENYLVVYTPPNYDPARAKPYPTLYLSHGRGGNEMNWTTSGVAGNILDNLIDSGQIQPIVVVMPNEMGFDDSGFYEPHDRDLIDNMMPYVEKHYHVSTSPKDRAFSGLSMGGMLTNSFMINHPEMFQYYGMMSAGLPEEMATLTPTQIAALKGKSILMGAGWQDPIFEAGFNTTQTGPAREVSTFAKAGIPVTTDFTNGGHEMYVWRTLLKDFLTRVAFLPQPYAAW
jgi:enterochelin esterase-like enzyme